MSTQEPYLGLEGTRPYEGVGQFYSQYRPKISEAFVQKVIAELGWSPKDRLLDLGTGTGQMVLRFAPHLAETVGLDPEPDQIAEARRQAGVQGIRNARFLVGGSDDLALLKPQLGTFRAVIMAEAFHWMLDKDRVLRDLSTMVDATDGAVLFINSGNLVWTDEKLAAARAAVRRCLDRQLNGVPPGPHPRGRHDPFEVILQRSPFPEIFFLEEEYELLVKPDVEALIGVEYTISHVLHRLGDRRKAFENDARRELAGFEANGPLKERRRDTAIIGRRCGAGIIAPADVGEKVKRSAERSAADFRS